MGIAFLYYVVFLIFGFGGMYCLFAPQAGRFEKNAVFSFFMQPILYVFFLYVLGAIGAFYLVPESDFIIIPNLMEILLPIFCMMLIYATAFLFGEKLSSVILIFCVALCIYLQPMENKFVPFGLNEYVFKCLAVVFFSIFCIGYKVLNVLPHTITIATGTMLLGVSLLSAIGGAPVYLALVSAVLLGSLMAYMGVNLHKIKIEFDNVSCAILAFMIFSIFKLDMAELSFGSCVIFTMIFWAELAVASVNKFLINKKGTLMQNSHFYAAAQKITLASMMSNIFKVGVICMFFGWFQLFSVNQYSLPIIAFFVVLWLNTSMGSNLLQTPKTLRQINSEFFADMKQNLKETKDTISKISNKKD